MTNPKIAAIERATGRSWDDWLAFFASIQADTLDHHAIATYLLAELEGMVDNRGWWAQATSNAYEHSIGRRVPGQQPDGTFRLSLSRSTELGMPELMSAWQEFAAADSDVSALVSAEPRVSGTENRMTWRVKGAEATIITVISEPKPNGTASLVVQHGGLPSQESSAESKELWLAIVTRFLGRIATGIE